MRVFHAIGLLLLITGQVKSMSTTLDDDSQSEFEEWLNEEFEEWLNEEFEHLILEVAESRDANSLMQEQTAGGELEIEKSAADALDDLHTWQELIGSECYGWGIQQLEILKKASLGEFLHCKRLKTGLEDIAKMVEKTCKVSLNVGKLVQFVASAMSKCKQGSKLKVSLCLVQFIPKFYHQIKSLVPTLKAYKLDMKKLGGEIKEIYKQCSNTNGHKMNMQVATILEGTKWCAINQQPFKYVY